MQFDANLLEPRQKKKKHEAALMSFCVAESSHKDPRFEISNYRPIEFELPC
jgi:hypothetical protein